MEIRVTGHNFENWPFKDHPCHVCTKLVNRLPIGNSRWPPWLDLVLTYDPMEKMFKISSERRVKCEKLTDDGRLPMRKAHMAYGQVSKKSANQKQESPVTAMFVNGSGRIDQSLQRTLHRCFLSSFNWLIFCSPGHRPCELFSWASVRRPLAFHI
jgi:hypothetical protein